MSRSEPKEGVDYAWIDLKPNQLTNEEKKIDKKNWLEKLREEFSKDFQDNPSELLFLEIFIEELIIKYLDEAETQITYAVIDKATMNRIKIIFEEIRKIKL